MQGQLKAAYVRRVSTTSKKYMGLAQSGVGIGRVVAVLHGGKTLHLLQRMGNQGYRLVGQYYIHGQMNGEVLPKPIPKTILQFNSGVYKHGEVKACMMHPGLKSSVVRTNHVSDHSTLHETYYRRSQDHILENRVENSVEARWSHKILDFDSIPVVC